MTELSKEQLYLAYRDKVLAYLRGRTESPEDAEDLCAEVFVKVLRGLDGYDEKKGSLSTWIYQITRFTLIDYLRTKHPGEPLPEELPAADDLEQSLLRKESLSQLAKALRTLDAQARTIVILRYDRGCSLTEIARILGVSYGAVKLRHKKALETLRRQLTGGSG